MSTAAVDTSLTGYTSGSVDKQDEIYRNRQRPQPYPLTQHDSGYESAAYLHSSSLLRSTSRSLLTVADSIKCGELLGNDCNFASASSTMCYQSDCSSITQHSLDETNFDEFINSFYTDAVPNSCPSVLVFFTSLTFHDSATYKAKTSLSKAAVETLLSRCKMNPLFLPDLMGRPNYWSPSLYSTNDGQGNLTSLDFFCQQPRFVVHGPHFKQRSPTSIYMRYDAVRKLTYYIVAAPEADECVTGLHNLLEVGSHGDQAKNVAFATIRHPLEAHVLLSRILCESSQYYVNTFRQSMFAKLRAVDELCVQGTDTNRDGLTNVTVELQIISKDVNKLISDIDVALRNLVKTQETLTRLNEGLVADSYDSCSCPSDLPLLSNLSIKHDLEGQLTESLEYLQSSMNKQMMWLHNYRDRKDIAMSLVFNLVTQQDAANNIGIAKAMRRDSSSMNGIALLTMVFLPGTFTSRSGGKAVWPFMADETGIIVQTILGAGVFSAYAQDRSIHVGGLWWFWAAVTLPLTSVVLALWGLFCWRREITAYLAPLGIKRKEELDVASKV